MANSPCLRWCYDEDDFTDCPGGGRDSHESRWCSTCDGYEETCDDYCVECGEDT
jgi:hypothetical protein